MYKKFIICDSVNSPPTKMKFTPGGTFTAG